MAGKSSDATVPMNPINFMRVDCAFVAALTRSAMGRDHLTRRTSRASARGPITAVREQRLFASRLPSGVSKLEQRHPGHELEESADYCNPIGGVQPEGADGRAQCAERYSEGLDRKRRQQATVLLPAATSEYSVRQQQEEVGQEQGSLSDRGRPGSCF
jgi:hypothetical protein